MYLYSLYTAWLHIFREKRVNCFGCSKTGNSGAVKAIAVPSAGPAFPGARSPTFGRRVVRTTAMADLGSSSRFYTNTAAGFSLLELLLAVGLIAVLAGLMYPALQKARSGTKDVQCIANLKGSGMALMNFISERQGVYRNWYSGTRDYPDPAQYWTWYVLYTASTKLSKDKLSQLRCPLAPGNDSTNLALHYGFYAGDPNGKQVDTPGGKAYDLRVWTYPTPSTGMMLADSLDGSGGQAHTIYPAAGLSRGAFHARHGGRTNIYFLDGHVESATPKRLNELGVKKYYNANGREADTPATP